MRCRPPLILASVVAVATFALLAVGCGGGGSPGVASVASSMTAATTTTKNGALAFSRCMRSNGVPNFPDPRPIGARTPKETLQQLGTSDSQSQAAVSACNYLTRSQAFASTAGPPPVRATGGCDSLTTCYTPRQLEAAYGILPLLQHGTDGRSETVVLPELAEPQFPLPASDIRRDLAQFDKLFHLPATRVRVVSTLAPSASPWLANGEEVLDTEMVHAIAPRAAIVEVLVKGTSVNNATSGVAASVAALRLGTSLGGVISISAAGQTGGEHCDTHAEVTALHAALRNAAKHHVTVVAASGDIGAVGEPCQLFKGLTGGTFPPIKEANLPASDPLVLGAGGTTLTASHKTGAYISENAWGLPFGDPGSEFQASGGGLSRVFARPGYQNHLRGLGAYRGVPDASIPRRNRGEQHCAFPAQNDQWLPRRARLGPGHRLGQPQRKRAHPVARSLCPP
jgi:subtilase family serine protease